MGVKRKDPDCICRTCLVFPCCVAKYNEMPAVSTAKKIVDGCSYFRSYYKPMLKNIKDALENEGRNSNGLHLLIENPFIQREYPPKNYLNFK